MSTAGIVTAAAVAILVDNVDNVDRILHDKRRYAGQSELLSVSDQSHWLGTTYVCRLACRHDVTTKLHGCINKV